MSDSGGKAKTIYFNGIVVGEVEAIGDDSVDIEVARKLLNEKGLLKPISQQDQMFRQAVSFATTSAYLYKKDLSSAPRNQFSLVPFVVNSAFGIELYLKTLGHVHGVKLTGHELLKLYDSLPPAARDAIDAMVPTCAAQRGLSLPLSIRDCISELNNAFIEWRYVYERDPSATVRVQEMIFVMQCLHEVCNAAQGT
ncbi:MAG: hypothetical protein Q7K57_45230 [Burkholderiaceae bacterium]|nr:hypothetical protein [Burkholderiaceae bacterium]